MKAIVKTERKKGFEYRTIPVPVLEANEVLVQIHSVTICGSDVMLYDWSPAIRWVVETTPFIPGHECSGIITEMGPAVRSLTVGDRVAVETHLPCGECFQCRTGEQHICKNMKLFGHNFDGCFADYAAVPESIVFKIRDELTLDKAVLLEPMGVAFQAVEKAQVCGDSVAIIGAGPIGLMSLYLARKMGACLSIVVDFNQYRLDLARELGADLVLSPATVDIENEVLKATRGDGVGRIIDASGSAQALTECFFYLRKGGRLVLAGNPKEDVVIRQPIQSLIHKEITIKGVHGRRMFDTWEKTQRFLLDDAFPLNVFVTHEFPMVQFEDAFQLIESGGCSKIRLRPG